MLRAAGALRVAFELPCLRTLVLLGRLYVLFLFVVELSFDDEDDDVFLTLVLLFAPSTLFAAGLRDCVEEAFAGVLLLLPPACATGTRLLLEELLRTLATGILSRTLAGRAATPG